MSGIFLPKTIKICNWFSSYGQKCRGCFFETQCSSDLAMLFLLFLLLINYAVTIRRAAVQITCKLFSRQNENDIEPRFRSAKF